MTKKKIRFLMAHDKQLYSREIDSLYKTINDRRSSDGTKVLGISTKDSKEESQGANSGAKGVSKFKFGGLGAAKKEAKKNQTSAIVKPQGTKTKSAEESLEDTYVVKDINQSQVPKLVGDDESLINKNILIDGIVGSVVNVSHGPGAFYSSAKIRNISKSLVYLNDQIQGPVYLEDISDSVIVVSDCQQFRMHDSNNTLLIVECESKRPIIESCKDLVFAQAEDVLDGNHKPWTTVDDFNWLVPGTQSKHWRPLAKAFVGQVKELLTNSLSSNLETTTLNEIISETFK